MSDVDKWSRATALARVEFAQMIRQFGFAVTETEVNWVLISAAGHSAHELRSLLAVRGVLVRDCASFGMASVARVAVPRASEMDRVSAAFKQVAGGLAR